MDKKKEYSNRDVHSGSNVAKFNQLSLQGPNPKAFFSFEDLIELSEKNSSEITSILIAQQEAFSNLLESNLDPAWIVLTIAILSKVCSSSFTEEQFTIMSIAAKVSFTRSLEFYLNMQLPFGNVDEFFVNLTEVFKCWIKIMPTATCKLLSKLLKSIDITIPYVEKVHSVAAIGSTKSKIKALIEKMNLKENLEQKNIEILPNDFRNEIVYPTIEEIMSSKLVFPRKNIIEGGYESEYHYAGVQFRLVKEDFLADLRKIIPDFSEQERRISRITKFPSMTIFPNIVFRSLIFRQGKEGVILDFSEQKFNQIFSSGSKRFICGSLIIFTKDNFSSILCGRVIDKDPIKKQVAVSFDPQFYSYELNVPYLMVEYQYFFEPYYHVLKALQLMPDSDFPMKKYLIDAIPTVEPPDYLDSNSSLYEIKSFKDVNLFGNNWPTADQLHLDQTQYSAFKAALTQKFAVIQGPPGTGKTFLGLQIVKTLLGNSKFWYNKTPILIVAVTNHALDQFLEGLIPTTKKILRIGGQSKNEKLWQFNLKSVRKEYQGRNLWKFDMDCIQGNLTNCHEFLKYLQDYDNLIAFKHFANIDGNIKYSWFRHASNADLEAWLFPWQSSMNSQFNLQTFRISGENEQAQADIFTNLSDIADESKPTILVSISSLEDDISNIQRYLQHLNSRNFTQVNDYAQKWEMESYLKDLQRKLKYFKMRILNRATSAPPLQPRNVNYKSPHLMHPNDRWNLYYYWLNLYNQDVIRKITELKNEYAKVCEMYNRAQNVKDIKIMQDMLVIGMTTTAAARLKTTLQELKCQIVIVEEAAQVSESHVTVSLTGDCKHLILIGDHQQLRPTTADYRIGKKYNLAISMFERMVINKMQCNILGVQHRMRPEIAQLIVPNIYPNLKNHDSVYNFPPITGIDSSLFFIHHEYQEIEDYGDKLNLFEAEYLISLACYLRQVGYEPEDITILSAYSGQVIYLCQESNKHKDLLNGVRISVVDNYQGEECKIVLLSLVRNNPNDKIGFLTSVRRVCVALSRAKQGLYIMGNMNLLCQNSEIWAKIKEVLLRQNCLGYYLTVNCKFHPNEITIIKEPKDFDRALDGSCSKICGRVMNCGHNCTRTCHTIDLDHSNTKCTAPCLRNLCDKGHPCPKLCYQDCERCMVKIPRKLECNHEIALPCSIDPNVFILCQVPVNATLPCGHNVSNKPCYIDGNTWKCKFLCNKLVGPCGHTCRFTCHVNTDPNHLVEYQCYMRCEKIAPGCASNIHRCKQVCYEDCRPCIVPVKKNFPNCNHSQIVHCSVNINLVKCLETCNKVFPCGHKCPKECHDACGECCEIVRKILPSCGHEVETMCKNPPNSIKCPHWCSKRLACGHQCRRKCFKHCSTNCVEMVDPIEAAPCGHNFKILCFFRSKISKILSDNTSVSQHCTEPCTQILECSHKCLGTCGKCYKDQIHLPCAKKCKTRLMCGHKRKVPCHTVDQFRNKNCSKCR